MARSKYSLDLVGLLVCLSPISPNRASCRPITTMTSNSCHTHTHTFAISFSSRSLCVSPRCRQKNVGLVVESHSGTMAMAILVISCHECPHVDGICRNATGFAGIDDAAAGRKPEFYSAARTAPPGIQESVLHHPSRSFALFLITNRIEHNRKPHPLVQHEPRLADTPSNRGDGYRQVTTTTSTCFAKT